MLFEGEYNLQSVCFSLGHPGMCLVGGSMVALYCHSLSVSAFIHVVLYRNPLFGTLFTKPVLWWEMVESSGTAAVALKLMSTSL